MSDLRHMVADKVISYLSDNNSTLETADEIISMVLDSLTVSDKNIRKAIAVLKSGTINPIIISDMANVLEREYSHMEAMNDRQSAHVEELIQDRSMVLDEAVRVFFREIDWFGEYNKKAAREKIEKLKD